MSAHGADMEILVATIVVWLGLAYAAVGIVFAALFVTRLAGRIDEAAKSGTWGFRLAIFPGAAALWPVLLLRLTRGPRRHLRETAHDRAAHAAGRRA